MDDNRFDAITKLLGASTERRGALGLLATLGIGWFGGNVENVDAKGNKKTKKKRKKKKKKRPLPFCPDAPLRDCLQEPAGEFAAAVSGCEASCAELDSAACRQCTAPAIAQMADATFSCANAVCRGGVIGETARARRADVAASAAATCDAAAVEQCYDDAKDDLKACLTVAVPVCFGGPLACGGAVIGCSVTLKGPFERCNRRPAGCGADGFCKGGICCPNRDDTNCNGTCCATSKCETCENGVCKGCGKDQVCTVSPAQVRTCRCLRNLEECGDQCCDHFACEACAFVDGVGTCFSECQPPTVCKRGAFTGSCVCPSGTVECGERCCDKDKCETCSGGTCRGCQPPKSCQDRQCRCPAGTSACGGNDCCNPQDCINGECRPNGCAVGRWPCGDFCAGDGDICCDAKRYYSRFNALGYERYCCNDGTGGPCFVGHVCCINSIGNHFCCEQKCNGDFCG